MNCGRYYSNKDTFRGLTYVIGTVKAEIEGIGAER